MTSNTSMIAVLSHSHIQKTDLVLRRNITFFNRPKDDGKYVNEPLSRKNSVYHVVNVATFVHAAYNCARRTELHDELKATITKTVVSTDRYAHDKTECVIQTKAVATTYKRLRNDTASQRRWRQY